MQYPAAQALTTPRALSPESLSEVIQQTRDHLNEAENRLHTLCLKVAPYVLGKDIIEATAPEDPGIIASASNMRNAASRIIELCSKLDSVL